MSQLEAEHILKKAATVTNIKVRDKFVQKAVRFMPFKEREAKEAERDRIKAMIEYRGPGAGSAEQKTSARKWQRYLEDDLEENSPPVLTADQRDAVAKRTAQLEEFIREGMLSEEEMRRNPVGAVDRHMKWERSRKLAIIEWKNHRRLLNPDSNEQDLANVEILRPRSAAPGMAATFMPDAQIPGQFAMTPQAKANWPEGMPEYGTVNSPMKQAEDREKEELKARLAQLEKELADAAPAITARQKMLDGLAKARAKRMASDERKLQKELDRLTKENESQAQAG